MDKRNVENGLALAGAVLVLVGVTFAAGSALAEETPGVDATAAVIHMAADEINSDAARDAAERIALDNALDLDIRFRSHISELVAVAS
jgi:hypothetical protein